MLTNPTIDMLRQMGLSGMATAFQELELKPEARSLQHGEWLTLLLEREATTRSQKRFEAEPVLPGCVMTLKLRTSISVQRAVSTATSFSSFPPATGSGNATAYC
ncbi:hypothetical protein RvVAR0630_pl05100 (plasmid) [Agrobacterium vitis]|nr:hypothetical protein RvVAR0630_pl05100 [Agrobacterium vitis]